MGYFFSTPVWGQNHVELFLDVGLPSLLASGNLPAFKDVEGCRYLIYTRAEDIKQIEESDAFQQLKKLMQVVIEPLVRPIEVPHTVMSECHADTLQRAEFSDAAAVFLPPDCVWAKGSLANMRKHAEAGKSVVHMTGVRLNRDTMLPSLVELKDNSSLLTIGSRDLVELGLKNLHTIALSHFWNEHEGGMLPANLYWSVPGEGLVIRCFHLHPLMVRPQVRGARFNSTIDDDLALSVCPDVSRDYIVVDSDEILAFELSAPSHAAGAPFPKGSIEGISAWAEIGTNKRHRELALATIRMHTNDLSEKSWNPVEREADKIMQEALEINQRSTPVLAFKNPSVLAWRGYAFMLGSGTFAGKQSYVSKLLHKVAKTVFPWAKTISFRFSR